MPDREEVWANAKHKTGGREKFLRKYAAFKILMFDEGLLDLSDESLRSMLFELIER
ncbi:hypothetical protein JOF28_002006 [Leucobacter exalbidus]|uniref:Uncharacterized protein n=1 Tax=Leucobacter exalbidus TaxID=662960 RepID=A0A940T4F5_9MICO|nr:hypothetical protein [Leucobacter exalbidus]